MADPKLEALIRMKIQKNMQPSGEPPIFDDTQPQPEAPPEPGALGQMVKNGADFSQFSDAPTQGMTQPQSVDAMHANNRSKYEMLRSTPVNGTMASPTGMANAAPLGPIDPVEQQAGLERSMAIRNPMGPEGRKLLMQALMEQAQKGGQALQGGASSAQAAIQQAMQQQYNPGGHPSGVPGTPMRPQPRR